MLALSLIIPVYNEERHIGKCLDAVSKQTVMPDEVIVVDNNCTDRTIEIARGYSFVKVITEQKQGRGYARSAGFRAASGDILGRIDADARINRDWVETVKKHFSDDPDLSGLTGLAKAAVLPGVNAVKSTFFSRFYYWFVHASFNTVTMWGSNMAVRGSVWERVEDKVLDDDLRVHEDQDISLWIAAIGGKILQEDTMLISVNGQGFRYLPKLIRYSFMFNRTRKIHENNGNLNSPNLRRLGFYNTLPGRLYASIIWICITPVVVLLFPFDYLIKQLWPKSWWLD